MTDKYETPGVWKVGSEVRLRYPHGAFGPLVYVEKVYKNGNVIIGGREYFPDGDTAPNPSVGGSIAYLMTEKAASDFDAEEEERIRRAGAIRVHYSVWKMRETITTDQLTRIEAILSEGE